MRQNIQLVTSTVTAYIRQDCLVNRHSEYRKLVHQSPVGSAVKSRRGYMHDFLNGGPFLDYKNASPLCSVYWRALLTWRLRTYPRGSSSRHVQIWLS